MEDARSLFLTKLDGAAELKDVLILATTNNPETLDASILSRPSRFDRVYVIGAPTMAIREQYIRRHFCLENPESLMKATEGFSMAYLREVRTTGRLKALQNGKEETTLNDYLAAANILKAHLTGSRRNFAASSERVGFASGS